MKADGRQVIVRGTGTAPGTDQDAAAVCIFESYTPLKAQAAGGKQDVHGIARMVQVGDTTLLDLTIKHDDLADVAISNGQSVFAVSVASENSANGHVPLKGNVPLSSSKSASMSSVLPHLPTAYGVYIARSGNISSGASSTGGIYRELGSVKLRQKDGYGDLFTEVTGLPIWDTIGRAMVIAPLDQTSLDVKQQAMKMGPGILAGVIARSAGAWSM